VTVTGNPGMPPMVPGDENGVYGRLPTEEIPDFQPDDGRETVEHLKMLVEYHREVRAVMVDPDPVLKLFEVVKQAEAILSWIRKGDQAILHYNDLGGLRKAVEALGV
jgi:hypothetical protein